jgi:hypothetical protein
MSSMHPFLCRAASIGLTNQRQSSVTDVAHSSALYTTSLQRSLSNHYACGGTSDPHDDNGNGDSDEDIFNEIPSRPPLLHR